MNNPLLADLMPGNVLWINDQEAAKLEIKDGDEVAVSSNGHTGRLKAKVTPLIHPEAVFRVHGFGHTLPVENRARGKGVADDALMPGGLEIWDQAGGGLALQQHSVTVHKANS